MSAEESTGSYLQEKELSRETLQLILSPAENVEANEVISRVSLFLSIRDRSHLKAGIPAGNKGFAEPLTNFQPHKLLIHYSSNANNQS